MDRQTHEIWVAIIIAYRKIIEERYHYENIKDRPDFPDSFSEARVDKFRNYFLDYIYPLPQKRDELNEAFESLDDYIKHPNKLLRIIIDSSSLIFKYGRHLPKILKTGIKALQSYRKASLFEERLVKGAMNLNMSPPFAEEDIERLIRNLSLAEIEEFIESSQNLFETLHDRKLVAKIKNIVEQLIGKMKKRPNVYSPAEIKGLEIGAEIIVKGDHLFAELSEAEQKKIFLFIIQLEREVLEGIFG